MRFRALLALVLPVVAALPSSASAIVAPGRVTVPFMSGHREGVDPFSVAGVAVMPDGRIVTSGIDAGARRLLLTRVLPSGSPDPTFGNDGIASLSIRRDPAMYGPFPGRPQLAPDGSIYIASSGLARSRDEGQQLVVTHVLSNGTLDPAFGTGGSTLPGVQGGSIALTDDGNILISGHTGRYNVDLANLPAIGDSTTAVVGRLTASGALDQTFGQGGIVSLPANDSGSVAALPGDAAAVIITKRDGPSLVELTADGHLAPAFNHGAPLPLPGSPNGLRVRSTGSVDLLVTDDRRTKGLLLRIRPDGTADPAFAATVPAGGLVPGPDGSDLVTGSASPEPEPGQPFTIFVRRVLADGTSDPLYGGANGHIFTMAFGGGYGTVGAIHSVPGVSTLNQSGFRGGAIAVRPGGGLVVAGAVGVIQYTGEGEGLEHEEVGLAAFGAELAPDTTFGGPAAFPSVSFSLPRQHAKTDADASRRFVVGRLSVSAPSLCQISVHARGAVVAKANVAVFSAGGQTSHIWLTKSGRKVLPRAKNAKATARVVCEDLVGSRTTRNAKGALR